MKYKALLVFLGLLLNLDVLATDVLVDANSLGAKVRNGTIVYMVVGMTFEDYMAGLLGPSWGDYIFT